MVVIIFTTYHIFISDQFSKNMPAILVQSLNTVFINPVIYSHRISEMIRERPSLTPSFNGTRLDDPERSKNERV